MGLVYSTDAVRDECLAAFVRTGLQRGQQVVLMARPDDHSWQASLALRGVDGARATRAGSLAMMDPPRFYPARGRPLWSSGWSLPVCRSLLRPVLGARFRGAAERAPVPELDASQRHPPALRDTSASRSPW